MVPGPAQVERQLGERRQGRFRSEMLGHTVNYSLYRQDGQSFLSGRLSVPGNCVADDLLGLLLNSLQMVPPSKTLGVNLVNVLSTRRSSREPSARRNHCDTADWRAIARRCRKNLLNSLPGEFSNLQMFRGELFM